MRDQGRVLRIAATFWDDHADRFPLDPGEVLATPLGRHGACVLIAADDPGLAPLLADARYYADPNAMDECPRRLRASAQRVVQVIECRQGARTAAGRKPQRATPTRLVRAGEFVKMPRGARARTPEGAGK